MPAPGDDQEPPDGRVPSSHHTAAQQSPRRHVQDRPATVYPCGGDLLEN